jgi:hypothetical protein
MTPAESDNENEAPFSATRRRELFLQLAATPGGVTTAEVHARSRELGDTATEEAYHNIARRLVHRSLLIADVSGKSARYEVGAQGDARWLEEDELARLVDPDYPIPAFTVWRESVQQVNDVPESVWEELRQRLTMTPARELFVDAIVSYCEEEFAPQIRELAALLTDEDSKELGRLRKHAEDTRRLLVRLTKYGLGLSNEAVQLPMAIDIAINAVRRGDPPVRVNRAVLDEEIRRRVEDTAFVVNCDVEPADRLMVGAVDGSTRGGLLSIAGEDGDFNVLHAPMISMNTAVGQLSHNVQVRGRQQNVFVRLPERPEDMQRLDNRHTVMAKLLYSDLTDSQYMHAVWNAMDLVEVRATLRLMKRWFATEVRVEVPPADVVLRDGTVTPQDRDFTHYKSQDSYGQIVRDLIEGEWDTALLSREDERVVCGVVKQSELGFYGPVLNWFASKVATEKRSQLVAWPMQSMNILPDQLLITRLLTAGRGKNASWQRTCIVARPFHAITNFAATYSRQGPPAERILEQHRERSMRLDELDQDEALFWSHFQGGNDRFVRMLRFVQYGSTFVATVPRLDKPNMLPRLELLLPTSTTEEAEEPWPIASRFLQRVLTALSQTGFDVAAEHQMFSSEPKLDVLPRLLIKAHDTVKIWAAELLGRVQEYVAFHLAQYTKSKRLRGVQVRPFSRQELEALYQQLKEERERAAGSRRISA